MVVLDAMADNVKGIVDVIFRFGLSDPRNGKPWLHLLSRFRLAGRNAQHNRPQILKLAQDNAEVK